MKESEAPEASQKVMKIRKVYPRQHICKTCGAGYKYLKLLIMHNKDAHGNTPKYICETCGKGAATYKQFQDHKRRTHATPTLNCGICKERRKPFKSNKAYDNHIQIYHTEKACPFCPEMCKDRAAYKKHYKKVHGKTRHKKSPCPFCGEILCSKFSLKRHLLNHHPDAEEDMGVGSHVVIEEVVVEVVEDVQFVVLDHNVEQMADM